MEGEIREIRCMVMPLHSNCARPRQARTIDNRQPLCAPARDKLQEADMNISTRITGLLGGGSDGWGVFHLSLIHI